MKHLVMKVILSVLMIGFFSVNVTTANANESVEPVWWWGKDRQQEEKPPEFEGGPEKGGREQQPVSNIELQQRFPGIVFLEGDASDNKIAITFDDGPDPRYTEQVLDVLNQYNVPATFFVMGARAEAYPDIVRRMNEEGHVIGNHTYWHPDLVEEGDVATLEAAVSQTEDIIAELVGYRTKLFRAPYGFLFDELVEKLGEMNYSVIGWSVDSLDWQEDPPEEIAANVLSETQPGSIILMHDGATWEGDRTNTIESLHEIIPALQEQGLEFVTVPNLLNIPYEQ